MTRYRTATTAVLCLCAAVSAQPAETTNPANPANPADAGVSSGPSRSSVAGSMEVAAHLWGVIGRYRFAATADLVRVTLVRPGGRSDMHSMEVRCVPGANGLARIELGELTIEARRGNLRAVHRRDPTTYFGESIAAAAETGPQLNPAEVLRSKLPPLPIPHLSLAFDAAEVDWCPLVTGLVWERAERLDDGTRDGVRLVGRTDMGKASLEMAGARVRRFEADLEPSGQTRVIVDCEALEPSDPDGWVLDVQGRRLASSLGALGPLGPRLEVGQALPRLDLSGVGDDEPPTLPDSEEPLLRLASSFRTVLFLRDDTAPEFVRGISSMLATAYADTARELLRGRLDGAYDKRVRLAGLAAAVEVTTDDSVLARLDSCAAAWREAIAATGRSFPKGAGIGWFVTDTRLVDRIALASEAAVVVVDDNGQIKAILPVHARTQQAEIASVLLQAIAPEG